MTSSSQPLHLNGNSALGDAYFIFEVRKARFSFLRNSWWRIAPGCSRVVTCAKVTQSPLDARRSLSAATRKERGAACLQGFNGILCNEKKKKKNLLRYCSWKSFNYSQVTLKCRMGGPRNNRRCRDELESVCFVSGI